MAHIYSVTKNLQATCHTFKLSHLAIDVLCDSVKTNKHIPGNMFKTLNFKPLCIQLEGLPKLDATYQMLHQNADFEQGFVKIQPGWHNDLTTT